MCMHVCAHLTPSKECLAVVVFLSFFSCFFFFFCIDAQIMWLLCEYLCVDGMWNVDALLLLLLFVYYPMCVAYARTPFFYIFDFSK